MGDNKENFFINLDDEVVRGSIILRDGKMLWPPPPPPAAPVAAKPAAVEAKKEVLPPNYFQETLKDAMVYTGGLGSIVGLGMAAPNNAFSTMTTTFGLAGIVGYHVVWGVTPALHSPLM